MKTRTVWRQIGGPRWIYGNAIWCFGSADVRWINCYGYAIGTISLWSTGKIIGDE